jgi:hypothetical protein
MPDQRTLHFLIRRLVFLAAKRYSNRAATRVNLLKG